MMQNHMLIALPVLLAPAVGTCQSVVNEQKSPDFGMVAAALRVPADPSSVLPVHAHQDAAITTYRHGAFASDTNISCSLPCEAEDERSVALPVQERTEYVHRQPAVRPEPGAPALPQVCGPSPLSAAEIERLVERVALAQGVDPQLAKAVTWAESRFDRVRNSPKGARGPMQLMPATANALGVTDPCDPHANIEGGVRHLRRLLAQFGHPLLAVAAYNAGSRAVIDHNGIPPFAETLGYVARVINRQLGPLPVRRDTAVEPTSAGVLVQADRQARVLGAVSHRFVNGVMHLSGQGGFQ